MLGRYNRRSEHVGLMPRICRLSESEITVRNGPGFWPSAVTGNGKKHSRMRASMVDSLPNVQLLVKLEAYYRLKRVNRS